MASRQGLAKGADVGIDWAFIRQWEGSWLEGYVPNSPTAKGTLASGVTVLAGFDLGQQSLPSINELPVSAALKARLRPYVGLRGAAAVMALQHRFEDALDVLARLNGQTASGVRSAPQGVKGGLTGVIRAVAAGERPTQFVARRELLPGLQLTPAEAAELEPVVHAQYRGRLALAYDRAARTKCFDTLPDGVQTALMSLSWQCGYVWAHKAVQPTRQIFDAAVRRDWRDAVDTFHAEPFPRPADKARRRAEGSRLAAAVGLTLPLNGPKALRYNTETVNRAQLRARTA